MGIKVERTYKLSTNGGQVLYLSESEAQTLSVATTVLTLVCDSPRCKARFEQAEPTSRSWAVEDAQTNPDNVPEDANRFIPINNGNVVCSKQCLKDWAEYSYVRPPSPRELRAKMEEDKKKQAEELKDLNPHLVAPPDPVQIRTEQAQRLSASAMPAVEVKALCQADGHADE